ncbi:hypothetical protein [Nitratireductor sp. GCM10026969]|uniref:hypothetical protein n=1 Tax=Nitratireductor sp. GCM10026969 TaxID=3252645 RepID=UPI003616E582
MSLTHNRTYSDRDLGPESLKNGMARAVTNPFTVFETLREFCKFEANWLWFGTA